MPVTVGEITRIPGVELVAGRKGASREVRWVHVSELDDPTPWLKGGELLLTTGMGVGRTPARQRAYIARLVGAGLSGLGFGLGFSYSKVPKALAEAADAHRFPIFVVPYAVPFIAITEAVSTRLLHEQYETLQRAGEAQNAMTRAVLEERGLPGIAEELARAVGGWALLIDLHGLALAATSRAAAQRLERVWEEIRTSRPEGTGFSLTLVDQGHHVWVQPLGPRGRVEAFLAVGKPHPLSQLDRVVASRALALFAIEMGKSRAVAEAERRLQGDFFQALAGGRLTAAEINRGLARFGFPKSSPVVVVAVEGGDAEELTWVAEDALSRRGGPFLISRDDAGVYLLLPHDGGDGLGGLVQELGERSGAETRAGSGSAVEPAQVARSLREARYALEVCRLEAWRSAGFEHLGSYRLLLSMVDSDALRAFADSLLGPLDAYDARHGGELIVSLRAFLDHNARWETAAAELYVHRHTLRYRVRKIEELTGRDLASSFDRMEFWLALRARELMSASADGEA